MSGDLTAQQLIFDYPFETNTISDFYILTATLLLFDQTGTPRPPLPRSPSLSSNSLRPFFSSLLKW